MTPAQRKDRIKTLKFRLEQCHAEMRRLYDDTKRMRINTKNTASELQSLEAETEKEG